MLVLLVRSSADASSLFGLLDRGAAALLRSRLTFAVAPRVVQPNGFLLFGRRLKLVASADASSLFGHLDPRRLEPNVLLMFSGNRLFLPGHFASALVACLSV